MPGHSPVLPLAAAALLLATSACTGGDAASSSGAAGGGAPDGSEPVAGGGDQSAPGGTGGDTAGGPCLDASDCVDPPGDCASAVCDAGTCAIRNAPDGEATTTQSAGDCRRAVCDGDGGTRHVADEADTPLTLDTCTVARCDGDTPAVDDAPEGTLCGTSGLLLCDGAGSCVGCTAAADCGPDAACLTRTCDAGTCGADLAEAGTFLADPSPGDCRSDVCDGAGGVVAAAPDDGDAPADDTNECTTPICADGQAISALADEGASCSLGGAGTCDGTGACRVDCTADADCGTDTPCRDVTCDVASGACQIVSRPPGTVVDDPDSRDCRSTTCDGLGNVVAVADDEEVPLFDDNECTDDVCVAGWAYPATLPGAPCTGGACDGSGVCTLRPFVLTTAPYDTEERQSALDPVVITFSEAMEPASITAQSDASSSTCTGTIQVSEDDFASCIPLVVTMEQGDTVARAVPAPALSHGRWLRLRVTGDARSADGRPLLRPLEMETGWSTRLDRGAYGLDGSVVIAEVHGGAGEPGAAVDRDYVVLHNRGNEPVSIGSWSLQSRGDGGAWARQDLEGTLAPGGHLLVALAEGNGGGALPAPDVTGTLPLRSASGTVALLTTQSTLGAGACPLDDDALVDLVGWGSATCTEGAPAPAPAGNRALTRVQGACADTGNGAADFLSVAPSPRASGAAPWLCQPPRVLNETGAVNEADACSFSPGDVAVQAGGAVAIEVLVEEETPLPAVGPREPLVEVGVGPRSSNPQTQPTSWAWTAASFAGASNGADRFTTSVVATGEGPLGHVARVSFDGGASWTFCDADGAGSNAGLLFDVAQVGLIAVEP